MIEEDSKERKPEESGAPDLPLESAVRDLPYEDEEPSYIVGVGASAGGLEALERLFGCMPEKSGMAFVVVQHLSPDFRSVMDELLARWTKLAISNCEDGTVVRPDRIYLMPPKKLMIISGGKLWLKEKVRTDELSLPIDEFLKSLAQDAGLKSIGIILSGTGSDGSRGVQAIHDAGGYVLVQDTASAKFDGMPRSAIETGCVDEILSPELMASSMVRYANEPRLTESIGLVDEDSSCLLDIFSILKNSHGIDFSLYKRNTIARRIKRRIELLREESLESYSKRLLEDNLESVALCEDLLIGVTQLFRDPAGFQTLQSSVFPQLFEGLQPDQEIRVWSAGCCTGEEAYSLAILLHEYMQKIGAQASVKVFATDVNRKSIDFAIAGTYPRESIAHINSERLQKYFQETSSGFQVNSDIRKMVVFAKHNLLKDSPFTKLDLIVCRNLLIYFLPVVQKQILSLFHFGLRSNGVLFLGPSESPGELSDEFGTLDHHWRIFKKLRDGRLPVDAKTLYFGGVDRSRQLDSPNKARKQSDPILLELLMSVVASDSAASILLDANRKLIHSFGDTGRFLKIKTGKASLDVVDLVDDQLKISVSGAIHRCQREAATVTFTNIRLGQGALETRIKLSAQPLRLSDTKAAYTLLRFDDYPASYHAVEKQGSEGDLSIEEVSHDRFTSLETELQYTKENLQSTIEELEASNEELQATNEEMQASNEELQSTNEELHSVNEELYTVNAEYQRKIAELTELTNDMDNLLLSTDVHTIFLDENLCIRKFTPKMAELFHLIAPDIGRRIEGFMHSIRFDDLPKKLNEVLQNGLTFNVEVETIAGDCFLMRILPYKGQTEQSGVVMTLIDITNLKKAESRFQQAIEASPSGMLIVASDGTIKLINEQCERIFGFSRGELIGQSVDKLIPKRFGDQHVHHRLGYFAAPALRSMTQILDVWGVRKDGTEIPLDIRLSPIEHSEGVAALASVVDMTKSKGLESSLRSQVDQRDRFLATLSHELRNPMAAIVSAATLLDRVSSRESAVAEPCAIILRQATQLTTLLDDLLDVSRVTQGKINLRSEPTDLREICNESLEALASLIAAHRHNIQVCFPEQPVFVEVDRGRMIQVVENLLTNAIKYTPDAGSIVLGLTLEDAQVVMSVRDNGRGIHAELIESIFDMFVQSDATLEHSDGGMGVGLTLVRALVGLHGGTISASSPGIGLGSEFRVALPLTDRRPHKIGPDLPVQARGSLRIVLVEDNRDARLMLETILSLNGDSVTSASNGLQGLQMVLDEQPSLAVIDIGLPGMDGYAIAREIRRQTTKPITLVALTGYGRDEDRQAVFDAGFDHHLVKPIRIETLEGIIASLKSPR